jgi:hypothetical protein
MSSVLALPALIANELDVRRGRMDELAGRLVPLLRSVRAGIDRYYSDKPFTMKVIAKYTKETDPDIIDRTYEFYRKAGFRRELMISELGVQGILDFLSETYQKQRKPCQRSSLTIASSAS